MRHGWLGMTVLGALVSLSGTALADHNSKWGEGTANMPNDVHNMRIETMGDNEAFREFVQKGNGADSVNRYATEDDEAQGAAAASRKGGGGRTERGEAAKGGGNSAGNAGSGNGGDGVGDRTRTNSRIRTEAHKSAEGAANGSAAQKRDRIRNETHARNSMRDSARAMRGSGGRGRGR